MPYLIATHSMPADPHPGHRHSGIKAATTRRAVATLEEARAIARETVPRVFSPFIPASGCTIGPLPDGTVIEVEPTTWYKLAEAVGMASNPFNTEILDAYNARGQSCA